MGIIETDFTGLMNSFGRILKLSFLLKSLIYQIINARVQPILKSGNKSIQIDMVFSYTRHKIRATAFWFTIIHTFMFPVVGTRTPLLGCDDVHVDRALLSFLFKDDCTTELTLEDHLNRILFWGGCGPGKACDYFVFIFMFLIKELTVMFEGVNDILEEYWSNIVWLGPIAINDGENKLEKICLIHLWSL